MAKYEHTFLDTGITVRIKKVSPLLMMRLEEKFPRPQPPKNKVELDGNVIWEDNPADPAYVESLDSYEREHNSRLQRLLIRRGVDYTLNGEDQKQVAELRDFWKDEYGDDLPGNDLEIFVAYIAIGSPEDLNELTEKILNRIQPTEKKVAEATDRFRPDISGESLDGDQGETVGGAVLSAVGVEAGG